MIYISINKDNTIKMHNFINKYYLFQQIVSILMCIQIILIIVLNIKSIWMNIAESKLYKLYISLYIILFIISCISIFAKKSLLNNQLFILIILLFLFISILTLIIKTQWDDDRPAKISIVIKINFLNVHNLMILNL